MTPRRLRSITIVTACLIGVGLILFFLLFPTIGRWAVRTRVLPKVAAKLGRDIKVKSIRVGYGDVTLEGITVTGPEDPPGMPFATVARVAVDFELWPALIGDVRLGKMIVERPELSLWRGIGGRDNWSDLVERLRGRDGAPGGGGRGGGMTPRELEVREGTVAITDRREGVQGQVLRWEARAKRGRPARLELHQASARLDIGPAASAESITVDTDLADPERPFTIEIGGGAVSVLPSLSLTGIHGRVASSSLRGRASVELEGGYGGVAETLWRAEGWLDPERRDADLHLRADRFTLDKLAPLVEGTPIQHPENGAISASLDLVLRGSEVTFVGGLELSGLDLEHELLAAEPVTNLGFGGSIKGRFDRHARLLSVDELGVRFRGIEVRLDGYGALPGGHDPEGVVRAKPRLKLHVVVPRVPCQQALAAIPPALAPRLQGFKLKGGFETDLVLEVDWADLEELVLKGSVGIFKCKVLEPPEDVDAELLLVEFEHFVEVEQDNWISFTVGPSNPDFVPLADVSPHLLNSLMTTEDNSFFKHHGFITREFRSALVKDLQEGYFKYGASSITMQMVKNVLLYREKTLSRKLQELFLTWYVETALPKERIFEIYVNVIEFGPGIYGVGPAARHYFGKHPRDLNPVEAAFFSSILPSPKRRYMQYCEGELTRWGDAKVQRIIKTMHQRERLTDEEFQTALATPLLFDRTEALPEKECKEMTRRMIKKARPTHPPKVKQGEKEPKKKKGRYGKQSG